MRTRTIETYKGQGRDGFSESDRVATKRWIERLNADGVTKKQIADRAGIPAINISRICKPHIKNCGTTQGISRAYGERVIATIKDICGRDPRTGRPVS